jgi:hypothetical protein
MKKISLGEGVSVEFQQDLEVGPVDLGGYPSDLDGNAIEEMLDEVVTGDSKRSRKTFVSSEQVQTKPMIEITYSGFLAADGAEEIYIHYGYGNKWTNGRTLLMTQERKGRWVLPIPLKNNGALHFCFTDGKDNWDNNGGTNWSITRGAAIMDYDASALGKPRRNKVKDKS